MNANHSYLLTSSVIITSRFQTSELFTKRIFEIKAVNQLSRVCDNLGCAIWGISGILLSLAMKIEYFGISIF